MPSSPLRLALGEEMNFLDLQAIGLSDLLSTLLERLLVISVLGGDAATTNGITAIELDHRHVEGLDSVADGRDLDYVSHEIVPLGTRPIYMVDIDQQKGPSVCLAPQVENISGRS